MTVTTYLMGGCANQMFQYAAGYGLARRFGAELLLDNSRYDSDSEWRVYSLGLFKINERVVKQMTGKVIKYTALPYDPDLYRVGRPPCSIYGYWQTEKYFAEYKAELKEKFQPRDPILPDHAYMERMILSEGEQSVFLTIRRTDYVGSSFHGLLSMEYYLKAAELIASRVHDPHFFIFTDEPGWVNAENFPLPYRWSIAGNYHRTVKPHLGREDAELYLMSKCRHAVMANSSYSWMGAWLGRPDGGGIVVAPQNWFGPTSNEDPRDVVPERWIKM